MSGIARDVDQIERDLRKLEIENEAIKVERDHFKNVARIHEERIALLESERDRYFRTTAEVGQLCESVADMLIKGITRFRENEELRRRPEDPTPRIARTGQFKVEQNETESGTIVPSQEATDAVAELNRLYGEVTGHNTAALLPRSSI